MKLEFLCTSDSVEEENKIEEQSGRPIQRQFPQLQREKAKTTCREYITSLSGFPFNQVRKRRTCRVIFPLFTGSCIKIRSFCNI